METHIVEPVGRHVATVLFLHGFTECGESAASRWVCKFRDCLGAAAFYGLRFVFPTAPVRSVSCYGSSKPSYNAWHGEI